MTEKIDWNECLPFTGPEAALPTGTRLPKGIEIMDMLIPDSVKRTRSGGIMSLKIDEEAYAALTETYPGQIMIMDANGKAVSREAWYASMGQSDGLKLAIIRELNKQVIRRPFVIGGN